VLKEYYLVGPFYYSTSESCRAEGGKTVASGTEYLSFRGIRSCLLLCLWPVPLHSCLDYREIVLEVSRVEGRKVGIVWL